MTRHILIALHTLLLWWYGHTKCTRQTVFSDWKIYIYIYIYSDISVVALSQVWVCGRLLAGIGGLNPAGGMGVCLLWVLSGRGLCNGLITRPELLYWVLYFPAHKTHFFPEKCDLNSTCVLCAKGKYYFQTYKYPYMYYTSSLLWDSENNREDDFSGSDDDFLGFFDE